LHTTCQYKSSSPSDLEENNSSNSNHHEAAASTTAAVSEEPDPVKRGTMQRRQDAIASYSTSNHQQTERKSSILSISCGNLAGAVSTKATDEDDTVNYNGMDATSTATKPITVSFSPSQPFVACTGETGSGKSLLFAKAIDLITGGRATASMVGGREDEHTMTTTTTKSHTAFVEIVLLLEEPHLSFVQQILTKMGINMDNNNNSSSNLLTLRRTLVRSLAERPRARLKSICSVNGNPVTLKTLAMLASPLLVVVDASTAASALSQPHARLSILDVGVKPAVHTFFAAARRELRQRQKDRQRLEQELENRLLPQSFSMDSEEDIKLMNHWIAEMDGLRARVEELVERMPTDNTSDNEKSSVAQMVNALQLAKWTTNSVEEGHYYTSAVYEHLKSLRQSLQALDDQWNAASNAANVLSSLSITESAATALETSRKLLYDAVDGPVQSSRLDEASEASHSLLNKVEEALVACSRFIEDSDQGLLATIEGIRESCPVSVEMIDTIILDWNTIARKHNIPPASLPTCHMSMINERDGNVEALALLPKALAAEKEALANFELACQHLSADRRKVSSRLLESVNRRLPALGMAASTFDIILNNAARIGTDAAAYSSGCDSVTFMLHQGQPVNDSSGSASSTPTGGDLNQVASSGEKARILLAMECSLPGSIRAATQSSANSKSAYTGLSAPPPIAVVYDEIDAHVGGRAAVALGHMLADQALQLQVLAITHSPAVAASADTHIVVRKSMLAKHMLIDVVPVCDIDRCKEVARMAAGDVAVEEAEAFASALIQDAAERRRRKRQSEG
jgi:DNA repair ATPase RecN